jgi:hypothetical protein
MISGCFYGFGKCQIIGGFDLVLVRTACAAVYFGKKESPANCGAFFSVTASGFKPETF